MVMFNVLASRKLAGTLYVDTRDLERLSANFAEAKVGRVETLWRSPHL